MVIRSDTVKNFQKLTGWAIMVCKRMLEECNSDEILNEDQLFEVVLKDLHLIENCKYKLISYKR